MVAGNHRFRAGRLLPGGFAHLSLQRAVRRHPGSPKAADGGRGPVRREHDPDRVHHPGVAVLHRLQRHAGAHLVDCHGAADGRGQPLVQATPRIGHRPDVGRRRCRSGGIGSGLLAVAGQLRLDRHLRGHRAGRRRPHPGPDAVLPEISRPKKVCWLTEPRPQTRPRSGSARRRPNCDSRCSSAR